MTAALSEIDIKILVALQEDSRLTVQELADRVGTSPSSCWRRLKSLEETGVIRRYTALVDPKAASVGECVFAHVTLERHKENAVEQFETAIADMPEVLECFAVTAGHMHQLDEGSGHIIDRHHVGCPEVGDRDR